VATLLSTLTVIFIVQEKNKVAMVSVSMFCRRMGIKLVKLIIGNCEDMVKWWEVINLGIGNRE